MNKCKSEMKRSVTEDKGGIDERDKSEKEGEMRTKKKKNMNSLYASMSSRRFLNGNEGPNSWHVECRVVHIEP